VGEVDQFAGVAEADRGECFHFAHSKRQQNFFDVGEHAGLHPSHRVCLWSGNKDRDHILRRHGDGLAGCGEKNVCEPAFKTLASTWASGRKRNVDSHLIAVEIRVERGADQRVNANGFAFHQDRFERLNAEAMRVGARSEGTG